MILRFNLFVLSMLTCSMAWAVGFGQVETKSYLSEPLDVRIPLILSGEEQKSKLQVTLATPREYQTLEQDIPQSYTLLRVDVEEKTGDLWVKISSTQAIDESFLTLILKVQRGRGNFYKSIQVFLDPAWHTPTQAAAEEAEVGKLAADKVAAKNVTPVKNTPIETHAQAQQPLLAPLSSDWARRTSYGPVQSGDNLSEIAYRLRKDKRFSNHQVMLTLFDANPQAFEHNDINRLKKGAFIQVPASQDVQAFLSSSDYQDLKKVLARKKEKAREVGHGSDERLNQKPKRKFYSKVSLGMTESLGASRNTLNSINDAVVLSRLKKLEPLHDQVMASSIRIDSIGTKVESLAEEVRSLHQKVEALAKVNATQGVVSQKSEGYGWWWFLLLLIVNLVLLLFFLYRRQRQLWQEKLEKAQYKHVYDVPELKKESFDNDTIQSEFFDNALHDDLPIVENTPENSPIPHHPMDDDMPTVEAESINVHLADEDDKNEHMDERSEKIYIDHAALFEVAIQKEAWKIAEEHYQNMAENVKTQPRIQASYIQMLHYEKRIIDRNNALLNLFKTYDKTKWNRFCSLFDDDAWQQLQDERVISFTGNVIEDGVKHSNIAEEEMASLLAISDLDVLSTAEQDPFITEDSSKDSLNSLNDVDDLMDKTVVMNAKDLVKLGNKQASKGQESSYMDTGDVGKWGKVEETTDDDLMLEVDFDVEEELKEDEPEEEVVFTEIDVEFTGEIEPLKEEKKE